MESLRLVLCWCTRFFCNFSHTTAHNVREKLGHNVGRLKFPEGRRSHDQTHKSFDSKAFKGTLRKVIFQNPIGPVLSF